MTSILSEAEELVLNSRVEEYGDPVENWEHVAQLWSSYLGQEIKPEEAVDMMILVKLSRKKIGTPKTDSNRDIAGYALIAELVENCEKHFEELRLDDY